MQASEHLCASPPPHRNRRSECLVGAARCPDRPTSGQTGSVSYSALSDCDGLQREGSSLAPPVERRQRKDGKWDRRQKGREKKEINNQCIQYIKSDSTFVLNMAVIHYMAKGLWTPDYLLKLRPQTRNCMIVWEVSVLCSITISLHWVEPKHVPGL